MLLRSKGLVRVCLCNYARKVNLSSASSSEVSHDVLISDSCVMKLKQLCDSSDNFLRLCVESGGCSGFQYKFDLDNKLAKDDRIFEKEGAKVVVDETSLQFIKGATIDYHTELIRSAFRVVNNPSNLFSMGVGSLIRSIFSLYVVSSPWSVLLINLWVNACSAQINKKIPAQRARGKMGIFRLNKASYTTERHFDHTYYKQLKLKTIERNYTWHK